MRFALSSTCIAAVGALSLPAAAQDAQIAVAANFTAAAEDLAAAFAEETGLAIGLSFGATGQLYTQITQGAPFAALLAADDERPTRLVEEGFGVEGSVFTYAVGRLALLTAAADVEVTAASLSGDYQFLAIAEPAAAPYGAAALETIAALGLSDALTPKLVVGQNIAQAYQFVATGNAEFGFVALAQILAEPIGSYWLVPENLHAPILQDAVLIADAPGVAVAAEFLDFLRSPVGAAIIAGHGYAIDGAAE